MADRDENITTRFKADITNLKAGITEANRHIKLANAEFKAAASGMDDWTKSADGISAKLESLDTVMSEQKKVLSNLEKQYELTVAAQGENSTAAENLEIKIANQKATINKTAREIDKFNNELDSLQNAEQDAERASGDLEDGLNDLGDAAEDSKDGFTVMKGALSDLVSDAIGSAISGVKDFVGQLWELPEATKEFRSVFGAMQQSASDSVIGVEGATDAYEQFFAIAGDEGQAAEATSHIAGLVNEQGNLQGALDGVIGAWVEYGDSITIEGLAEAADETAKTGTVTGQFADALNWAGESEDEFNERLGKLNSKQERQKLIIETLNQLYGENANKYRENNESLVDANLANLKLLESQSKLAEAVEPFTALLTNMKAEALDAITPAIEILSEKLQSVANFITENIGTLGPIITGVATSFGVLAAALMISNIITAVQKAFSLLNLTLLANPFVLIAAAVTGLVAGLVHLWNTNEDFRNAVKGIWEDIKQTFINALDTIKGAWSTVKDFFANVAEGIKTVFVAIPAWFKQKFSDAKAKIVEAFSDIKEKFNTILEKIKSVFSVDALKEAGKHLLTGLWNGISNKVAWLKSKVKGVVDKIKGWFTGKDGFDEHSPSKWSEKVSKYVMDGLGKGFVFDMQPVKKVVENIKTTVESSKESISNMRNTAAGIRSDSSAAQAAGKNVTYNFYQTNNSPKALSRLSIYRQTKNLLAMKGAQ